MAPTSISTYTVPPTAGAGGLLAVHLRPRSTRTGAYGHDTLDTTPGEHALALDVPDRLVPELDRLWAVHAHDFQLAYYQFRIPTAPPPQHPTQAPQPPAGGADRQASQRTQEQPS
ncbi:hypothetical protein [Streptomyces syringium]|uniref:hypothetical protein n=1 Tax=Streptomyces syringium TaxID=76729 RepID=UPI003418B9F8